MKYLIFTLSLLLALATNSFADGAYKWVDKDGIVNFGNNPPPDAKEVTALSGERISRYSGSTAANRYQEFLDRNRSRSSTGNMEGSFEKEEAVVQPPDTQETNQPENLPK